MTASLKDFGLKNVKYSAFASQETNCYEASLYYKGKKIAVVSNDGHGGCDNHYPLPGCELDWQDAVLAAKALPSTETNIMNKDGTPWMMDSDIETVCGELVNAWLLEKDFKRLVGKRVLWQKAGSDAIYQTPCAKNKATLQHWIKQVSEKSDTTKVLNELPMVEALDVFRKCA